MQRYQVGEDLDRYEDDFIEYDDDDDQGRYEDRYEDEEDGEEEEEEKEEPMSEEAIKYLELREKLKAKHRSLLRRENGKNGVKNGVDVISSKLSNFGSFFGPSKPVIADRVIQESKSLLETRHLAPKVSPNRNDANNKVNMPSTSASNNGPRNNPPPRQVKSKAQIMKQTRDYSFLLSDDAEIPKEEKASGPPKSLVAKPGHENGRVTQAQAQAKRYEPSSHSGKNGYDGYEKRKPPSGISQAHDSRSAPPPKSSSANRASLPCDSRRQLELRKQPQPNRQVDSSGGNGSRHAVQKTLPPKKPLSSSDRRMPDSSSDRRMPDSSSDRRMPDSSSDRRMPDSSSDRRVPDSSSDRRMPVSSSDRRMPVSSSGRRMPVSSGDRRMAVSSGDRRMPVSSGDRRMSVSSGDRKLPVSSSERKPSATPAGNRASVVAKTSTLNRQSLPVAKPHASSVNSRLDHRRDVQRSTENRMLKRETIATSKYQPKQSSQNGHLIKKQNPAGQLRNSSAAFSKEQKIKKRKSPEPDIDDFRAEIRRMFGRPLEYHDDFDDDDDDIEVGGFDTIMEEEKISERIGRREDEIEFAKIQEEERQERLRKKARLNRMKQR